MEAVKTERRSVCYPAGLHGLLHDRGGASFKESEELEVHCDPANPGRLLLADLLPGRRGLSDGALGGAGLQSLYLSLG
ncbi:hypothetical protein D9M72_630070 [compost metagenome]